MATHSALIRQSPQSGRPILLVCAGKLNSELNSESTSILADPPFITNRDSETEERSSFAICKSLKLELSEAAGDFPLSHLNLMVKTTSPDGSLVCTYSIWPNTPIPMLKSSVFRNVNKTDLFNAPIKGAESFLLMPIKHSPSKVFSGKFLGEFIAAALLTDNILIFASASAFVDRSYWPGEFNCGLV